MDCYEKQFGIQLLVALGCLNGVAISALFHYRLLVLNGKKLLRSRKHIELAMIGILVVVAHLYPNISFSPGVSAFVEPWQTWAARRCMPRHQITHSDPPEMSTSSDSATIEHTWSPQDLTKDNPEFQKIPDDDYIKIYHENPELWPVEFFLIAYRRSKTDEAGRTETQVLVRKSANGTSKYGVGTGVPADPIMLANSGQIYTMFPQMPDPMPLPSTPPEELKKEIASRYSRMIEAGRYPHQDEYGRTFTHISTSNVSNTIHCVLFFGSYRPSPRSKIWVR
jgi:hypothetical protein